MVAPGSDVSHGSTDNLQLICDSYFEISQILVQDIDGFAESVCDGTKTRAQPAGSGRSIR